MRPSTECGDGVSRGSVLELKEILRLWLAGVPKKAAAQQLGFDVKTVRRYIAAGSQRARSLPQARRAHRRRLARVVAATQPGGGRPRTASWTVCSCSPSPDLAWPVTNSCAIGSLCVERVSD
jgi:hypothetical protein